jgi:hypothetical protein
MEGVVLADGFDDALIGTGWQYSNPVAVYSYKKCVEILMKRDSMSHDEAVEFMEYNVLGAWVGESTPVFIDDLKGE